MVVSAENTSLTYFTVVGLGARRTNQVTSDKNDQKNKQCITTLGSDSVQLALRDAVKDMQGNQAKNPRFVKNTKQGIN